MDEEFKLPHCEKIVRSGATTANEFHELILQPKELLVSDNQKNPTWDSMSVTHNFNYTLGKAHTINKKGCDNVNRILNVPLTTPLRNLYFFVSPVQFEHNLLSVPQSDQDRVEPGNIFMICRPPFLLSQLSAAGKRAHLSQVIAPKLESLLQHASAHLKECIFKGFKLACSFSFSCLLLLGFSGGLGDAPAEAAAPLAGLC